MAATNRGKGRFTVEVEKKRRDEDFTFSLLSLFHRECMGGTILKIMSDLSGQYWRLICTRCNAEVGVSQGGTISIIKTAIDGEEREIEGYFAGYDHMFVVQRV